MNNGNFKVKCVMSCSKNLSIGKEYDVVDGYIYHENGKSIMQYYSIEEINNQFLSQFELVEEKENENMSKWNGKIRCLSTEGYTCFTKGKVYEINDGSITTDNGHVDYKYKSLSDFRNRVGAKFEEVFDDDLRKLIKPCMLVRCRDRVLRMAIQCEGEIVLKTSESIRYIDFSNYDNNLLLKKRTMEYLDIIEVYGYTNSRFTSLEIRKDYRDLIWKREEKSPQQIKIEEIERKQRELADELAELRKDM